MIDSDTIPDNDLAGWQVTSLRPAGHSRSLLRLARAHGAHADNLPLLRLRPGHAGNVRQVLAGIPDDARWLFTSPASARFLAALAPGVLAARGAVAHAAGHGRVFAPGRGTAHALQALGIHEVAIPETRYDSEGLLALPALAAPLHGELVLVGAPGGRELLATELTRRGLRVTALMVYRRAPVRLPPRRWTIPWNRDHLALIVTSAAMLARLHAEAPEATWRHLCAHARVVVASERLARLAHASGFRRTLQARSPADADLIDALRAHARAQGAARDTG